MFVADRERKREADLELVVFTNDPLCQLKKSWQQQCDQIGRFLKVLCNMVSDMAKFWAKMKSITFFMLKYCDYSLGNFWKNLDNFLIQNSAWQQQ